MNRRDFIKGLLAAGVAAKAAPAFAKEFITENVVDSGFEEVGGGWFRVWKTVPDDGIKTVTFGPLSQEIDGFQRPVVENASVYRSDAPQASGHNLMLNSDDYVVDGMQPEFGMTMLQAERPHPEVLTMSCYVKLLDGEAPTPDFLSAQ